MCRDDLMTYFLRLKDLVEVSRQFLLARFLVFFQFLPPRSEKLFFGEILLNFGHNSLFFSYSRTPTNSQNI